MTTKDIEWQSFLEQAVAILSDFQCNRISMTEVFRFFEDRSDLLADDDTLEAISNAVSEIDGFPRHYDELVRFLGTYPSRSALLVRLKN
jgi:hypothetical protein